MALHRMRAALLLIIIGFSEVKLSTCQVIRGNVTCTHCTTHYDFSGIKIEVKCDKVKKVALTATEKDGTFEAQLPSNSKLSSRSPNCLAKLLGGPNQLYAETKSSVAKVVKDDKTNWYTVSTPLAFSTSCPSGMEIFCGKHLNFGSSKTIDLPLPREWGLPPSSYFVPFIPIIGIP